MERSGPVTLRDVARSADVHPSTASRALNAGTRSLVNAETVQRIVEAAERLGYHPNSLARGLKMNRTFTVGMLVPDLTNPLFPPIVRGLEDRLLEVGYTLVVANTDNQLVKERAVLEAMQRRRVDGLVLATARREYNLLDALAEASLPCVLINRTTDAPRVSSVVGDDHAGMGLVVRHLAELGHRRIAHVAGTQQVSTGLARYQSFLSWMHSEGLEPDEELVVFADWFQEDAGAEAFRGLLDRRRDFTAVVAANDLVALGCYRVCRERGIDVPGDLSVVGYNDIRFCDKFAPPLTSVHIPHYDIGVRAAEFLLEAIEEPTHKPVSVRVQPTLSVRESTGPPPPPR